jgi:hypothetical protein
VPRLHLYIGGSLCHDYARTGKNTMVGDIKKRFCSTGSHWAIGEFRKIGTNRWICAVCYQQRKIELRNLPRNRKLAARGAAKKA